MPSTNFIDKNTVITASYMNEVDDAVFLGIGDGTSAPTSPTEVKTNLGLENVDNTSDANKPVSTATQTALDLKSNLATTVTKDSSTGAAQLPTGTQAQRPTGAAGLIRFNSDIPAFEGHNGTTWGEIGGGGGATGGGTDEVFQENGTTVNFDYTLTTGKNAFSVGPISVSSGKVVTVPSGQRWVVL